jgi:hypothetical protein
VAKIRRRHSETNVSHGKISGMILTKIYTDLLKLLSLHISVTMLLIWWNKCMIGKLKPEITKWTCREYYTWNGRFKYSVLISYNNYRFQRSKKFPFASVANVTQTILATPPLKSHDATWRSSTANTDSLFTINFLFQWLKITIIILKSLRS